MNMVESIVKSFRSLRAEIPPNERPPAFAHCLTDEVAAIIRNHEQEILTLATISSLQVLDEKDDPPSGCSVSIVNEKLSVYLNLEGNINKAAQHEKLGKQMEGIQKQTDALNKTMSASGYQEKVPEHIRRENDAKLITLMQQLKLCEDAIQHLHQESAAESSVNGAC